jgi:hypothetical protein
MTQSVCDTHDVAAAYEPSDELRAAREALEEVKAVTKKMLDEATERFHKAISDEVAKPTRPADVARYLGWHAGYVRKIARDHGVPGFLDVEPPPPRRRRRPSSEPETGKDHG